MEKSGKQEIEEVGHIAPAFTRQREINTPGNLMLSCPYTTEYYLGNGTAHRDVLNLEKVGFYWISKLGKGLQCLLTRKYIRDGEIAQWIKHSLCTIV